MQFGRTFEEFTIGDVYRHVPGRTITESDNQMFSLLTMNHNPLHIDAHYAERTQHGQRVVVGLLILSVAVGMSVADVSGKAIANLEYQDVRHLAPVYVGDTIYAETTVLDARPSQSKPDRGIVHVETRARNQHGVDVLSFRRRVMIPKAGHDIPFVPESAEA